MFFGNNVTYGNGTYKNVTNCDVTIENNKLITMWHITIF